MLSNERMVLCVAGREGNECMGVMQHGRSFRLSGALCHRSLQLRSAFSYRYKVN